MRKIFTLLTFLLLGMCSYIMAQTTIKGKVLDNTGLPLPGVTVKVNQTNVSTPTDVNGVYSIAAAQGNTITFTYIGFTSQTLPVGAVQTLDVRLAPSANNLNDVVVIGYGTRAVKDVTGAISSVKADRLENENPASVTDIIRGNIPGISVALNTSAKGGNTSDLQVRGKATLSGNLEPLIVLDGVIYFGQLADINPNDIDRIDVLRDPSALAVYGAQSAGGVVAITTKKGRTGAPRITLNGNFGIAQLAKNQKFYQGEDFLNWRADAARSSNVNNPYYFYSNPNNLPEGVTLAQFMGSSTGDPTTVWLTRLGLFNNEITNYRNGKVTDWSKLIFRNGYRQDYTASLSGASETVKYYMSGNYTKNQNLIKGGDFKDGRIRVNLEGKAAKFLTIGANSQFSSRDESGGSNPFGNPSVDNHEVDWGQIINSSPYGDVYNADGSLRRINTDDSGLNQRNPFLGYVYNQNSYIQNVLFSNLFARVDLPFGIKYNLNFSPQIEAYRNFFFRPGANPNEIPVNGLTGTGYRSMENRYRYNIDNILSWNKTFGQHNFDATFLLNKEKYNTWYTRTNNSQFSPTDVLGYHNIGAGALPVESSDDRVYNADAIMGRLNYTLMGRYILTGTFRRDGFSVFGINHPYGYFPSAALAWIFTDESFMKKDSFKWLNYGKLRLTYGANGNRLSSGTADPSLGLSTLNINKYPTQDAAGVVTNNSAIYISSLQNLQLKWERTVGTNIGLDFTVLNNRLSGSIDVYNRKTKDLLVRRDILWVQGYNASNNIQIGGTNNSNVFTNIGEINNKGIEVSLDAKIVKSRNFNWSATGTFFLNRNKIKHLYGEYQTTDAAGNTVTRENNDLTNGWFIGRDINTVWDYKILGVWQQSDAAEIAAINTRYNIGLRPGDFKLEDVNGDQRWDNNDKQFLGSTNPKYSWSLRNDVNFLKNFDFSLMLISSVGQLRQYNQAVNNPGSVGFLRMNSYVQPYWTPDNPINDYARLSSGQSGTTVNVWRKSSFVRIQNISLGYTIPQNVIKRFGIQSAKVFVNATNPFVLTSWEFWDPQNNGPTPRFWAAGFNVNF